jgi:hypothetical protein
MIELPPLSRHVTLLLLALVSAPLPTLAGTPYEAQIGGFLTAALQTLITGEFAGRSPSNADAQPQRPICKPSDYDDLRAAANDRAAFDAFRRRCHLVETKVDSTHVHGTVYLPSGYCEALKNVFDKMMATEVYAAAEEKGEWVVFEHKGSRYEATRRTLARRAQIKSSCQADGSLRISAPRKPN